MKEYPFKKAFFVAMSVILALTAYTGNLWTDRVQALERQALTFVTRKELRDAILDFKDALGGYSVRTTKDSGIERDRP